jgi:histone-lysine N-methyltransferase SETMAR
VTTETVEELHRELLPHPTYSSDLAPSDFHLFGPLKKALGRKIFRIDDEVNFSCNDGWKSNHKPFLKVA